MGARHRWRRPKVEPGATMALVELVASEYPELLRFVVDSLAGSEARLALLEVVKAFDAENPIELVQLASTAAAQLDRLEMHAIRKRWKDPAYFGDSLPAEILERFARARINRTHQQGLERPPELLRGDRLLRVAAEKERAADLVNGLLRDPARKAPATGQGSAAALVRRFLGEAARE